MSGTKSSRVALQLMLVVAACLVSGVIVGTRGLEVGTDTRAYADFYQSFDVEVATTRFEPGFVLIASLARSLGLSVAGYLTLLYGVLLGTVFVATRYYSATLSEARDRFLLFMAVVMAMMLASPFFVNASINVIRQGLASLVVFTALMAFQRHRWVAFSAYGAAALSLHYSSALFLVCAPILLFGLRTQFAVVTVVCVVYCLGVSADLVRAVAPGLHASVNEFQAGAAYRSGTRFDFATFTMVWYVLPHAVARFVRESCRERIKAAGAVYGVMTLPFFALGWGNFADRYLLPAWLAASLILASVWFCARVQVLRTPVVINGALLCATAAFWMWVLHATAA